MRSHTFHEKAIKKEGVLEIFWVQTGAHMPWQSRSQVKSIKQEKEKKLFLRHRAEHVLVDHVAAGVSEPGPLFFLFDKRHERQFHVDTRDMPNIFSSSTCCACMKSAFGISAGQSSWHWPQFTQESAMWANRIRWNMKLGGTSPGFT